MASGSGDIIDAVVDSWLADPLLKTRGTGTSKLSLVLNSKVSRVDVRENVNVLLPVVSLMGMKPNIDLVAEATRKFLWKTRPRGKPELKSSWAILCVNWKCHFDHWCINLFSIYLFLLPPFRQSCSQRRMES